VARYAPRDCWTASGRSGAADRPGIGRELAAGGNIPASGVLGLPKNGPNSLPVTIRPGSWSAGMGPGSAPPPARVQELGDGHGM